MGKEQTVLPGRSLVESILVPAPGAAADGRVIGSMGTGAWAWGDRIFWGYGNGYHHDDVRAAFETVMRAGAVFFDTAEVYGMGQSERLLGEFIHGSSAAVAIATKFFPFPWRLDSGSVVRALRGSLKRLGLQQVGLYQIHWPTPLVRIETLMKGLADAVDAGLTRAVGVSNFNVEQTRRAHAALAARGINLASNQVEYSLLQRSPERSGLLELCRDLGITVIAYSPLGSGLLTGKYSPDAPPPGVRRSRYNRDYLLKLQPLIGLMREIGAGHGGKTPAQVALNWVIAKGAVPIPGAKNSRQAEENIGAVGWLLGADEVEALDRASRLS